MWDCKSSCTVLDASQLQLLQDVLKAYRHVSDSNSSANNLRLVDGYATIRSGTSSHGRTFQRSLAPQM